MLGLGTDAIRPIYLPFPVNKEHTLNRGRVAWWLVVPNLDGGGYLHDLMRLHPGTLTAGFTTRPTWKGTTRPGGFGHLQYDGTSAYVVIGKASALDPGTGDFTLSAWILTTTTATTMEILRNDGSGGVGLSILRVETTNKARFYNSSGGVADVSSTVSVNDGNWHRLVATRVGTVHSLYVDGQLSGTATAATGNITGTWSLGRGSGGAPFNGSIDDVGFWSRGLSSAEALADYELSRRGYPGVLNRVKSRVVTLLSPTVASTGRSTLMLLGVGG